MATQSKTIADEAVEGLEMPPTGMQRLVVNVHAVSSATGRFIYNGKYVDADHPKATVEVVRVLRGGVIEGDPDNDPTIQWLLDSLSVVREAEWVGPSTRRPTPRQIMQRIGELRGERVEDPGVIAKNSKVRLDAAARRSLGLDAKD